VSYKSITVSVQHSCCKIITEESVTIVKFCGSVMLLLDILLAYTKKFRNCDKCLF